MCRSATQSPGRCRRLFLRQATSNSEAGLALLPAGTTCAQKHETDNLGPCTDDFAANFDAATITGNVYWNTSGLLTDSFPGHGGGMHGFATVRGNESFEAWQSSE